MQAQNNLAACYINGHGVEQDLKQGKHCLSKAAAQGSNEAIKLLPHIRQHRTMQAAAGGVALEAKASTAISPRTT